MNKRSSVAGCACLSAAWVLLSAGCGSVEMPGFLKHPGAAGNSGQTAATEAGSGTTPGSDADLHRKEITGVAPLASVMLEKKCPFIVQPYELSTNVEVILEHAGKQGMSALGEAVANVTHTGNLAPSRQEGITASSRLAAKQLNWLPMNVEEMYGEREHRTETKVIGRDEKQGKKFYPIADKMLKEVLAKIGQPHAYHFKLFVLRESGRNALSRPGGYLYLEKGLLENPAYHPKAYFALAHEISHVLQRHETFELQSMIVDSFTFEADMQKTIASAGVSPDAVLSHVKTGKNIFIRHHIDQELQADACATRLLSRVFADRRQLEKSLNTFLADLPKTASADPASPASASASASPEARLAASVHDVVESPIKVHPSSTERVANLREMYVAVSAGEAAVGAR